MEVTAAAASDMLHKRALKQWHITSILLFPPALLLAWQQSTSVSVGDKQVAAASSQTPPQPGSCSWFLLNEK